MALDTTTPPHLSHSSPRTGDLHALCYGLNHGIQLATLTKKGSFSPTQPSQRTSAQLTQQNPGVGVDDGSSANDVTARGFFFRALVVVVGVFGYLYWDSEHNTMLKAPGIELKRN